MEKVLKDEGRTLSAGRAVVVSHSGGALVIAGRRYRTEPVEVVPSDGEDVVLFLAGPTDGGIFHLPYGYFALTDQIAVMRGRTGLFGQVTGTTRVGPE